MATENVGELVLFVEDELDISDGYRLDLEHYGGGRYAGLVAPTLHEARELVESPGLCGVIVDGRVPETPGASIPSGRPTTLDFVRGVRTKRPNLIMVAASSNPDSTAQLVDAGCNAGVGKLLAVETLLRLLEG